MGFEDISIHALREEGDPVFANLGEQAVLISIHALREEGDLARCNLFLTLMEFLSTPSARRATQCRPAYP